MSTAVLPAPTAPSAPLTTSTSPPAMIASKSIVSDVFCSTRLIDGRVEQPRRLVDRRVELGRGHARARRAAGRASSSVKKSPISLNSGRPAQVRADAVAEGVALLA